jgi:putative hemolysin
MTEIAVELAFIFILLILSFIFSGSEVSVFSISEVDLLKLGTERSRKSGLFLQYLSNPQKALVTILVGNMLVNLSASIIGERVSHILFVNHPLFYSVFIMTVLVLLFGEIVPKKIAASKPSKFGKRFITVINTTHTILYPFIFLMQRLISQKKDKKRSMSLTKDELLSAVEVGGSAGLDTASLNVLKNLIVHIDKPVIDIMIPRSEIQAISIDEYWSTIEGFIKDTTFSTVLFYRGDIDNIIGYISMTDMIGVRKKDLKGLLIEPLYVPETKTIFSLLGDFKEWNRSLAIVLDEYGGTSGLVTFKDIIDSILIQDMRVQSLIQQMTKRSWLVHGNTKITDVNMKLGLELPTESNTLGGYVVNKIGEIPREGAIVPLPQNFECTVRRSDDRQIELLELRKSDR